MRDEFLFADDMIVPSTVRLSYSTTFVGGISDRPGIYHTGNLKVVAVYFQYFRFMSLETLQFRYMCAPRAAFSCQSYQFVPNLSPYSVSIVVPEVLK